MANIPQKSKDATEEALTAIQEALNLRPGEPLASPAIADLFPDEQSSDENAPRRAANDDRASIGAILQALHRRPARLPYVIASGAAAVWVAGGLIAALLFRPELETAFASPAHRLCRAGRLCRRACRPGHLLLRARPHVPPLAGAAAGRRIHGRGGHAAGAAGSGRARVDRHRRPGHPPRSRRHGRRRRARARARRRAGSAGAQRSVRARARL